MFGEILSVEPTAHASPGEIARYADFSGGLIVGYRAVPVQIASGCKARVRQVHCGALDGRVTRAPAEKMGQSCRTC